MKLLLFLSILATGCEADFELATLEVEWKSCPLFSGTTGAGAECAEVLVPLDWEQPNEAQITLFVKRIERDQATKQLWMLNGGPGASGAPFESLAETLQDDNPDISLYLLDHRGTGRSARLGCPEEGDHTEGGDTITEAEWPSCVAALNDEWGEELRQFSTTNAAKDLGNLIAATRDGYQNVHVWGGSYGTMWAQRYLKLFPEQPDAISLNGITHPETTFAGYDREYDRVGREYLARCGSDPLCSSKVGTDPAKFVSDLYEKLDSGHCAPAVDAGLNRQSLRSLFANLLLWSWSERALIPALAYRLNRCDTGDLLAVGKFVSALTSAPQNPASKLRSPVLGFHIGLSELWSGSTPTVEDAEQTIADSVVSFGVTRTYATLAGIWPAYAEDEHANSIVSTDLPLLLQQGELDPATPVEPATDFASHFTGANQHYVVYPNAAHSFAAPIAGTTTSCVLIMWQEFLRDPFTRPSDCTDSIEPLDFACTPTLAATFFGTQDLWENP